MGANGFLHLHREEFSCLLVSQALPQSKLLSLGPKSSPLLQALPHIPNSRLLGPTESKPPLVFTAYSAIHRQGFLDPPRQHNLTFTTTHHLAQGSLDQWLYYDPQFGSGTTRPCALSFRDPPHSASNPSNNLAQPKHENPAKPWLSGNDKARLKTRLHLAKPMP